MRHRLQGELLTEFKTLEFLEDPIIAKHMPRDAPVDWAEPVYGEFVIRYGQVADEELSLNSH